MGMTTTSTDNASDLYAGLPLPRESKFIRVMDIYGLSRPDDSDSSIQCDLRVIDLDSENYPSFAALSYVWGFSAAGGHFITCGGCTLRVTPNCHSALQHLREKLGNFTIWIDAICINQKDEGEKMNQILLMGDIYSKAETTYIWLGEGTAATNRAMAYLKTAGYLSSFFRHEKTVEDELRKPRHWTAVWFAFIACFNLRNGVSPSVDHGLNQALLNVGRLNSGDSLGILYASYQDMDDLLDREWVRRIWTYQEILLASNPIVVCGGFHLPWARFSLGVTFLEYSGINYREGNPIIATLKTWAQIASSRDHLLSPDAACFANIQSCRRTDMPQTTLQRYRKFVVDVGQSTRILRRRNTEFMLVCFIAILVVAEVWILLRKLVGTPAIATTIPSRVINAATKASYRAAACAVACVSSDIPACSKACDAASSAAESVASLSSKLNNQLSYHAIDCALGPPLGVFFLAFLVSIIVFCGSARRKCPRLEYVSLAQSERIDLADGICNRKSKEKKDKAIGVQAVLQRLSKTTLSPIDNAQSLEYIYKQLCINLMEVTGSLQFLLPASLHSFPGNPSWVPDWSADFDSFWLESTLFRNRPVTATPGSMVHGKFDPRKNNILTVRGRQICTVAKCFKFQETFYTYDSSQRELHRENLRSTLHCQRIFQRRDKTVSLILKQMTGSHPRPRISERQIHAWKLFMKDVQYQDPETILSVLERRDSTLASSFGSHNLIRGRSSSKTILRTQISICNCLAKTGRIIFVTSHLHIEIPPSVRNLEELGGYSKREGETDWMPRRIGVGSRNVRAGDCVVLIAGVFSPLIIRRDSSSTRIVSPAAVQGVMEGQTWDVSWKAEDLEEFMLS